MIFLELFYTFLIIGAFTFGGGYSMIALIEGEVVDHWHWMTAAEFTDLLAVSQMTPGPVGINTATYAGYTAVAGAGYPAWAAVGGSLVASVAVIAVPVALVLLVSRWLLAHKENPRVGAAMRTVRLAVVGLIAAAALGLMTADNFGYAGLNFRFVASMAIFTAVFALSFFKKVSPVWLIVGSGAVGLIVF